MRKTIIFTGGGSGGHVVPALTLIKKLQKEVEANICYIGGRKSIEKELVAQIDVKYFSIFTGKLRRYLSFQNIMDILKVILGLVQSFFILIRFNRKETLLFSTGGFVSVPVVIAAWLMGKKIYLHEQTTRAGLANKICSKFASKIFLSFEESLKFFSKGEYIGYPVRDECLTSEIGAIIIKGQDINKIKKPILFVTGGGNGARLLNDLVKNHLNELKKDFFIIHQVGKIFINEYKDLEDENYIVLDFVGKEMIDLLKISKIIISRAGAGTVCELMALQKQSVFIPLKIAQKNEQYHNAMAANKKIGSIVIEEDQLEQINLLEIISKIEDHTASSKSELINPTKLLVDKIKESFSL